MAIMSVSPFNFQSEKGMNFNGSGKFISFYSFLKEITWGDDLESSTQHSNEGDLMKLSVRYKDKKQFFSNDAPNKVVLKIETGENSILSSQ